MFSEQGQSGKGIVRQGQTLKCSSDAYVTLMHGDNLLGARVLGQSLLDTGTTKDRVAMCTDTVSADTKEVLQADGWIIKPVSKIITSPSKREFGDAYSKLHAWNLTEYERVLYLDVDVAVVSNTDRLFDCGTFCASYQSFDVFHSGVMVIEPSTAIFQDMVEKAVTLTAYYGGDQGFLNEYFKDFNYAPLLNWSDSRRYYQPLRLPGSIEENMHINTADLVQPWVWWAHRIFESCRKWTCVRRRLQIYNHAPGLIPNPLFWAPYPLIFICFMALRFSYPLNASTDVMRNLKYFNDRFSHFIPLSILCLAYFISFNIVPTTMLPSQAEYVFWLWTSFLLLLFMGTYCCLCHAASRKSCEKLIAKTLLTLVLFVVFTVGHLLHTVLPLAISTENLRLLRGVLIPLALHMIVGQVSGDVIIYVWTKM